MSENNFNNENNNNENNNNENNFNNENNNENVIYYKNKNVFNYYEKIKEIGTGGDSRIFLVKNKETKIKYALKEIDKNSIHDKSQYQNEIENLKKLSHPNIIKLYEIYEKSNLIHLILEYCSGGDLFEEILSKSIENDHFSEKESSIIFKQIISAVVYCHSKKIVHRDLKPENILFLNENKENPTIKIIDFGFSKNFNENKMFEKVGTIYYMSPEILQGFYDELCDVWSCGIILYEMICGYPPFNGEDDFEIMRNINKMKFIFHENDWEKISNDCKDLIKKMLSERKQRIKPENILIHSWFKKFDEKYIKSIKIKSDCMKDFSLSNNRRKNILKFIANKLNDKNIKKIKHIFEKIDTNKNKKIDFNEFKKIIFFNKNLEELNSFEIQEMFHSLDQFNTGEIDYFDFIASNLDENVYLNDEKLKEVFNVFLKNENIINVQEIINELKLDEKEFNEFFEKNEENNNNNFIDFDEFIEIIKEILETNYN